jgi:V/A-type H+-transporting ATPase subunit E
VSEKLKILTDKIYEEGIFKAREESEKMLRHAQEEAARIREEAQRERTQLLDQAQEQVSALKRKTDAELRMAARKSIAQVQEHLKNLIVEKALGAPLAKGLEDADTLARAMEACAGALERNKAGNWAIAVPEEQLAAIKAALEAGKHRALADRLVVTSSAGVDRGFEVFPEGEGYSIRFDQAFFAAFFANFLSLETRTWLASAETP